MTVMLVIAAVFAGAAAGWFAREIASWAGEPLMVFPRGWSALSGAAAAGICAWATGWSWLLPAAVAAAAVGAVLAAVDIERYRLPNRLTLALYPLLGVLLLVSAAAGSSWTSFGRAWLGAAAMFSVFFALSLAGGMGGGDVKLAGAFGLVLGYAGWSWVYAGVLFPLVAAMVFILLRALGAVSKSALRSDQGRLIFGPFLVAGYVAAVALSGLVS